MTKVNIQEIAKQTAEKVVDDLASVIAENLAKNIAEGLEESKAIESAETQARKIVTGENQAKVTVKFIVSGAAQLHRLHLGDKEVELDKQGKGEEHHAAGKAFVHFAASGKTGDVLKVVMENTKPKVIELKVSDSSPFIVGHMNINVEDMA